MVGFVAGLPFLYQMVERRRQIRAEISAAAHRYAETYRWARRLLQRHLFGARRRRLPDVRHHADADLRSQSEHQLSARLHDACSSPGDIVKFKPIDRDEYDAIVADVDGGPLRAAHPPTSPSRSTTSTHDIDGYNAKLEEALHGH